MSQRQLASVLFTVLGVFIIVTRVPYIVAGAVYLVSSDASSEQGLAPQFASLALVLLSVLLGGALVLFRDRLADRLFPAGPSFGGPEFQAVGLSVLGCYFVIDGIGGLVRSLPFGRAEWAAIARVVLGAALFLGARALSRLWSLARTADTQPEAPRDTDKDT